MHGPATILVLAKKKAAGPGGFFDPMGEHGDMAMGPMETETPAGGMFDQSGGEMPEEMGKGASIQEALMHLRKAAAVLEGCEPEGKEEKEEEEEPEMEAEEPTEEEPKPAPKAKKSVPAFLKSKPMKY